MLHLKELWHSLADWAKPVILDHILATVVSVLVALAVGGYKVISWMIGRAREKRYRVILDTFDPNPNVPFLKTPEIIAEMIGQPHSQVETDLRELEKQGRVYRSMGYWHRGSGPAPPVVDNWGYR
jgi:hypothetical protein